MGQAVAHEAGPHVLSPRQLPPPRVSLEGHDDDHYMVQRLTVAGRRIVGTAVHDPTLYVFDPAAPGVVATVPTGRGRVVALVGSPDDSLVITGSDDQQVAVWDVETGVRVWAADGSSRMSVLAVAFARGSRLVLSGGTDGQLALWDAATGSCLQRLEQAHSAGVGSISVSGNTIATGGYDRVTRLWRLNDDGTALVRAGVLNCRLSPQETVLHVALAPMWLAVATTSESGLVRVWARPPDDADALAHVELPSSPAFDLNGGSGIVVIIRWCSDALLMTVQQSAARVHSVATQTCIWALSEPAIILMAISPANLVMPQFPRGVELVRVCCLEPLEPNADMCSWQLSAARANGHAHCVERLAALASTLGQTDKAAAAAKEEDAPAKKALCSEPSAPPTDAMLGPTAPPRPEAAAAAAAQTPPPPTYDASSCAKKFLATCAVCGRNAATRLLVPCGHLCLCMPDALAMSRQLQAGKPVLCPICRAASTHIVVLQIPE